MAEEISIVKPVPDRTPKELYNCKRCGYPAVSYLAKDEFGDFLYPIFCSNILGCLNGYHENARTFPMRTSLDWNAINRPSTPEQED
jgi:hypothetical protein